MKKFLALLLSIMLLSTAALAEVKIGQVEYAAHGTSCFAVLTVAMDGDTIVAAHIDEFQFMDAATAEGVPNSDASFGQNYPEGKVLASKVVNNGLYSTNMTTKAGATTPLGVSYNAIEAFVTGKTIAELEAAIEGKTKEEMVDAVSSSTLVDTLGYVQGLLAAAKAANTQTGYYTVYNKTGETVKTLAARAQEYFHLYRQLLIDARAFDHVELVVLTGGGAMLPGIADAAAAEMGKRVRIGLPRRAEGESALLQRPDSVVAAGLVQCAIDAGALGVENAWGVRRRQGFRERLKTFFIGDY